MGELNVLRKDIGWENDVTVRCDDKGLNGDVTTSHMYVMGADTLGVHFSRALALARKSMKFQWQEQIWYNHTLEQTDAITFTKAYRFRFYPPWYRYFPPGVVPAQGSQRLPRQLQLRNQVTHFGKSSSIWDMKVVDNTQPPGAHSPSSQRPLLQMEVMFLTADLKTRQPRDCTDRLGIPRDQLPRLQNPMRPQVAAAPTTPCYTTGATVRPDWIDENRHTNWKPYYWLCLDCVHQANTRGRYHGRYGDDIREAAIAELELVYHRESNLGERLQVITWDDPDRSGVIHCHVTRGEDLITHCKITYGMPTESGTSPDISPAKL